VPAHPRLKSIAVHRDGAQLILYRRALERVHLDDPTGSIAHLLELLSTGAHELADLPDAMAARGAPVSAAEVGQAVAEFDRLGILDDARGDDVLDAGTRERHQSNLRFYDLFSRLDHPSAGFQRAAERSSVLLLGAGGLGGGVLQSLVGLGVGRVTLVDCDVVETRNLARQFVYGPAAVGRRKVEAARDWAASYSPATHVVPVHERVTDTATVQELGRDADIVVCAIDSPDDVQLIVNDACFALGVPLVTGGLSYSTLTYWSVEPGRTPCRLCLELHRDEELATLAPALRRDPFLAPSAVNRATGPVAQIACGLVAMETMRYLTQTDPPVAAATYQVIELADGLATSQVGWQRHPGCRLCAGAHRRSRFSPLRRRGGEPAAVTVEGASA
jgi:molybdopterin/thiamine biosynthesis adenylyltransferase